MIDPTKTITTIDRIQRKAASILETNRDRIASFARKMVDESDPLYTLEWADGTFKCAAEIRIWNRVYAMASEGVTAEGIESELRHELIRVSGKIEASTSHCSNLAGNHYRAAVVSAYEWVVDTIRYESTNWPATGGA